MLTKDDYARLDQWLAVLTQCRCLDVADGNLVLHLAEGRRAPDTIVYASPAELARLGGLAERCGSHCAGVNVETPLPPRRHQPYSPPSVARHRGER